MHALYTVMYDVSNKTSDNKRIVGATETYYTIAKSGLKELVIGQSKKLRDQATDLTPWGAETNFYSSDVQKGTTKGFTNEAYDEYVAYVLAATAANWTIHEFLYSNNMTMTNNYMINAQCPMEMGDEEKKFYNYLYGFSEYSIIYVGIGEAIEE